jgi:hypothetical protein
MASGDGHYFDMDNCKEVLGILETDEADDSWLKTRGEMADVHLNNLLSTHLDSIPVLEEDITHDLTLAGTYYVARQYKIKNRDKQSADNYKNLFDEIIIGIKSRLVAIPTGRTRRTTATKDYFTNPLSDDPLLD